jgi:hypothetical protein
MPHSWHFPMTPVIDRVVRLQPRSVMDVGVGFGKWGLLIREALDFSQARLERTEWHTRIEGVEVFPYRSPLHEWVYDEIIWADVLEVQDSIKDFDLVLMSDVIEHIEKPAAARLLRGLVERNRNVIVSTPLDYFTQDIADNDHEHHVSHWTRGDFDEFVYDYDVAGGAAMVVTLAGSGATWPTRRDRTSSRLAYGLRPLARHGSAASVLKRALLKLAP